MNESNGCQKERKNEGNKILNAVFFNFLRAAHLSQAPLLTSPTCQTSQTVELHAPASKDVKGFQQSR